MTPQTEKKLFLFDAFALIYRAYFAFAKNPRINSKGQDTSAVLGLVNTLMDVQMKEQPTHWAICFDTSEPTERHIEYKEYKAHREAMPEGISTALPYIFKLMEALNIPVIAKPGFEADDVIGTLAKKAEKEGFTTYMMTPDKDFAQLVSDNIYMYRPPRMGNGAEIWGIPEVLKKFEIKRVDQVIDYLGMMGDASDNIPGIPGVGDKTAKKLLAQYDSMEGLYEHTNELKGKQKEKVRGVEKKKVPTPPPLYKKPVSRCAIRSYSRILVRKYDLRSYSSNPVSWGSFLFDTCCNCGRYVLIVLLVFLVWGSELNKKLAICLSGLYKKL